MAKVQRIGGCRTAELIDTTVLEARLAAVDAHINRLDARVTVLEAGAPPPEPGPDEAWKDFVLDFGAPTDGSDCSQQWGAASAWMRSVTGARPCLRLGPYTFSGIGLLCAGVHDGIIDGAGAIIPAGMWIGGQGMLAMDVAHSAPINSAERGTDRIVLKQGADAGKFAIGGWILVSGIGLQGGADLGYPPNFHNFEYHKIRSKDGSTLTLEEWLEFDYLDTWPAMQTPPSASDPTTNSGGPATIYAMHPDWGTTVEIRNLICTDPYSVYNGGSKTVILDNVTFTGRGPSCSLTKHWINRNCDMGGYSEAAELDKLTSNLVYDNCIGGGLWFQSTSITRATFCNGTRFDFIQGSPRNLILDNADIWALTAGQPYGIADTLTATNSVVADAGIGYHFITLDQYIYEQRPEGGVLKMSVKGNIAQCFPHPPGYAFAFGCYDGAAHIYPDRTDPFDGTYAEPDMFNITDIRLEGDPESGHIVFQTDLQQYPPACKFWGTPPTCAFALPYKTISPAKLERHLDAGWPRRRRSKPT